MTIVVIGASLIVYVANNTHETEDATEAIEELKVEGCLPARDNEKAIIRVETKVDTLIVEQKASEVRILEAIRHESP